MATADQIRAQIAVSKQELLQASEDVTRAWREKSDADVRQKLRRELEKVRDETASERQFAQNIRFLSAQVDADKDGPYLSDSQLPLGPQLKPPGCESGETARGVVDCQADVVKGEIEWSIKGFSWLQDTMKQNFMYELKSPSIRVGDHRFAMCYDPNKGEMGSHGQAGSLAIVHHEPPDSEGAVFRYKIWIKSKEQGYIQWGDPGSVCMTRDAHNMIFGPDVCSALHVPSGIFGMTHAQLQHSEWVIDDVLTAKLEVQVRPDVEVDETESFATGDSIEVPSSRLGDNLLLLLDDAVCSDVTFKVEGESIKAHSQILSASSEVLKRLFSCGMKESTSKEVTIEDCEPLIFKAFLRYLYSDSFASVEDLIISDTSRKSSDAAHTTSGSAKETKMLMLRQLLAISHKYQVTRLQVWCERKLSELISIEEACSVLVQAHLFEAKQLEKRCLDFINANMSEVVKTESFASLSQQWPQVSLKITLRVAGVSEGTTTTAMEVQEKVRKRKRDD